MAGQVPDPIKEMLARSKGQTNDLAKLYLKERAYTGRLTSKVRSRSLLLLWVGGILLAGFICFTLANTVGRSLLGLEESLDHHRGYLEQPQRSRNDQPAASDDQQEQPEPEAHP